jgi:myosin heavy subunit
MLTYADVCRYFNAEMLGRDQEEYAAEGVDWKQVRFESSRTLAYADVC